MTATEFKTYENRLRRVAARQGLKLMKSPRRDVRATDYGTYQLVDQSTNTVVSCGLQSGFGLSLEEIAEQLSE